MRRHRYIGTTPLLVAAAHSRAVAPGDVVDFDESIAPGQGQPYSLETALGADVSMFEPVPDESPKAGEPAALLDDGPTLEEYVAAGYPAGSYPPMGYAEKPSAGLDNYVAELAELVAGNAETAVRTIDSIEQRSVLNRLQAIEASGKNRISVLRAITDRLNKLASA